MTIYNCSSFPCNVEVKQGGVTLRSMNRTTFLLVYPIRFCLCLHDDKGV